MIDPVEPKLPPADLPAPAAPLTDPHAAYAPPQLLSFESQVETAVPVAEAYRPPGFFGDGTGRLRTVWRFMVFGVGFFITELAAGICAGLVVVAYWFATGEFQKAGAPDSDAFMNNLQRLLKDSGGLVLCVGAIFNAPFSLALVMLLRRFIDRRPIWTMGFVWPARRWSANIPVGLCAGAVPILLSFGVVTALGGFELRGVRFSPAAIWYLVPLILAAFHEEILFRSYLLQNLLDMRRPMFGVLFTSVIFWLVHGLNPAAWSTPFVGINLLLAGVLLALAYMVSDNIWFPTAMHFAWNYFQGPILGIPVSGLPMQGMIDLRVNDAAHPYLTGGPFGLEGSAVCAGVQVIVIAILFVAYRDRKTMYGEDSFTVATD